jgi:hypothetical protein
VLAAIQIRAFTSGAYLRLVVVAAVMLISLALAIALTDTDTLRMVGATAVLAASALLLAAVPDRAAASDGLISLTDWLAGLRRVATPVTVTTITFDDRAATGEARAEARRLARWRERRIGRRISGRIERRRGAVASLGPGRLSWYDASSWSEADRRKTDEWIVGIGGGLVAGPPIHVRYGDGAEAARVVATELVQSPDGDEAIDGTAGPRTSDALMAFRAEFPSGAVLVPGRPAPGWVRDLSSGQHRDILRAALSYARHLRTDRPAVDHEVTSLCVDGSLRAIFLVHRDAPPAVRRRWRATIRDTNLLAAIGADDGSRAIRLADAGARS